MGTVKHNKLTPHYDKEVRHSLNLNPADIHNTYTNLTCYGHLFSKSNDIATRNKDFN